ncbi:hypothetical protein DJ030_00020, partial [bacterium endosymbiont of Escarpia laminata]
YYMHVTVTSTFKRTVVVYTDTRVFLVLLLFMASYYMHVTVTSTFKRTVVVYTDTRVFLMLLLFMASYYIRGVGRILYWSGPSGIQASNE